MPSGVRSLHRGAVASSRVLAPSTVNTLSLPGTSGNYVSTPDSAANSITGDIDIRAKLKMASWAPGGGNVVSKYTASLSYTFQFYGGDGRLRLWVSTTGEDLLSAPSDAATGFAADSTHWVRATRVAATGAVSYYTSDDGTTWTQLGTTQSGTAGNIFNGTQSLMIGAGAAGGTESPLAGNVYYAELRNGIGGTVVASFDATAVTKIGTRNPTTYTAPTGEVWTVNGSAWDWASV